MTLLAAADTEGRIPPMKGLRYRRTRRGVWHVVSLLRQAVGWEPGDTAFCGRRVGGCPTEREVYLIGRERLCVKCADLWHGDPEDYEALYAKGRA